MQLLFTERTPTNSPAIKTLPSAPIVKYIVKSGEIQATLPVQEVERKLLTKVLNKSEVTYGMIKTVQNVKSCCSGAK